MRRPSLPGKRRRVLGSLTSTIIVGVNKVQRHAAVSSRQSETADQGMKMGGAVNPEQKHAAKEDAIGSDTDSDAGVEGYRNE